MIYSIADISKLRKDIGMRQDDFASKAGLSVRHLRDIERGNLGNISFGKISNVCAALGKKVLIVFIDEE